MCDLSTYNGANILQHEKNSLSDPPCQRWFYKNVSYHRLNGPACSEIHSSYYIGGVLHRLNAPSRISPFSELFSATSFEEYAIAGNLHNITGPAIVYHDPSFNSRFYINETEYSESEYNQILKVHSQRADAKAS